MKILKDHPATLEFALQSGKLIQNFGVVELTSYRWIETLSGSSVAVEIAMEVPLAKRIDIILRLLDRDTPFFDSEQKDKAKTLWKQVRDKGCELRITVAHGTVGLGFEGDHTSSEPVTAGVLKLRKWSDTDQLMSIEELKDAVNTTANIVEQLNAMLGDA